MEDDEEYLMINNNMTEERLPFQKKCILVSEIGLIEAQTVDMLGVKTDKILPFRDFLSAKII